MTLKTPIKILNLITLTGIMVLTVYGLLYLGDYRTHVRISHELTEAAFECMMVPNEDYDWLPAAISQYTMRLYNVNSPVTEFTTPEASDSVEQLELLIHYAESDLTHLGALAIRGTNITDEVVAQLLSNLTVENLNLYDTELSNEDLLQLTNYPPMRTLALSGLTDTLSTNTINALQRHGIFLLNYQ